MIRLLCLALDLVWMVFGGIFLPILLQFSTDPLFSTNIPLSGDDAQRFLTSLPSTYYPSNASLQGDTDYYQVYLHVYPEQLYLAFLDSPWDVSSLSTSLLFSNCCDIYTLNAVTSVFTERLNTTLDLLPFIVRRTGNSLSSTQVVAGLSLSTSISLVVLKRLYKKIPKICMTLLYVAQYCLMWAQLATVIRAQLVPVTYLMAYISLLSLLSLGSFYLYSINRHIYPA
ncbi:BA75_04088T0 [Komagataella pastoris]|uniref:BA75_04088T0 n=1 Tax=Komagataella pastoris TaxID=4922 RepID=A0A1B2JFZ9_PICPA|nr:BA75_04088T0 [Komagataella pastoris]